MACGRYMWAIVECDGRICTGSQDGWIRVWSRAGEKERTLKEVADGRSRVEDEDQDAFEYDWLRALVVCEDRLISFYEFGKLRVGNVATGECKQVLRHNDEVSAVAAWGSGSHRCSTMQTRCCRWQDGGTSWRAAVKMEASGCGTWGRARMTPRSPATQKE